MGSKITADRTTSRKFRNKTIADKQKNSKTEYIIANIIAFITLLAFGFIAIMSFIQTSVLDPENYVGEVILYQTDNIALNLAFTAIVVAVLFLLKKKYNFFAKINLKYLEIALLAYVLLIGFVWIFSVTSVPAADSYNLFEAATRAAKGDLSFLQNGSEFHNKDYYSGYSYFNFYPFQLGFVFFSEIIYRIFGTESYMPMQIINVLCVACAYLGIVKITKLIFKRRSIQFFSIILLAGCIQPILLCTFVYGNITGMCCAIWASYFLIKYFNTKKYILMLPCGLLLVLAVLLKYNNMIYVVAFALLLIIHTIKAKKWQSIAFALAICVASLGSIQLVISSYEARGDVKLADGVSQVLYLDLGMSESNMAPGWYTSVAKGTYAANGLDTKAANAQGMNDIKARLNAFSSDLDYTIDFFSKKVLSQWNEPTYESIWVSEVKSHTNEVNGIGNAVYDGSLGQLLEIHFNLYMQILFLLFAIGIFLLIVRSKINIETILLPLVMLGAFSYHLLFEGKSQYLATYLILMIPTASYALNSIMEGKYKPIKKITDKLKTVPKTENK